MIETLTEKQQQRLEVYFTDYGASQPFLDYVAEQWSTVYPQGLPAIKQSHPEWTDGQVKAESFCQFMKGYPNLVRGLAKRLREDTPEELARSASLFSRLRLWWGTRDETDCFLNFSNDMLIALSSGDIFAIQKFAHTAPKTAETGPWASRLLHAGIVAKVLRDTKLLSDAITEFKRWSKPKKYMTCIYQCFEGILNQDSVTVNQGLSNLLKTSNRIWRLFDELKIVSLETHGMYELCRWYNYDLVAKFDGGRRLPWDSGLQDWVAQNKCLNPFHEVSDLSPTLHHWLETLPISDALCHNWN